MSEIKRINIYMGIVGQAYVDKETARKNLEAAQKNVVDINEIIADAQAQMIVAENALSKAINAKEFAQDTIDHLNERIGELNQTDLLYGELNSLKDELNANDTDGNGFNGGNVQTADENIANIQRQIEELQSIISDAQESLVRRQEHVAECQEAYENAVEVFESYLPADDRPSKFDLFDQEEEILKARIAAVVAALKEANLITEAINNTSEDTVIRAINIIVNVCNVLDAKMEDATTRFNEYKSSINALINEANDLKNTINALENVDPIEQTQLVSNISEFIEELNGNLSTINSSLEQLRSMFNDNEDIIQRWEGNQELIAEVFSIEYFDESINDISELNGLINVITKSLVTIKGEVTANRRELNRYIREVVYLENNIVINEDGDVIDTNKEYSFISYGNEFGTAQYATGTVKATGERIKINDLFYTQVEVITNSIEGWVGQKFYIISTAKQGETLYQLYGLNEQPIDVWVKIVESENTEPEPSPIEQGKYYWYVGQVDPRTIEEADVTIVTDTQSQGWRLVEDPDTYVFDAIASDKAIWSDPVASATWYMALPINETVTAYDGFGTKLNPQEWGEYVVQTTFAGNTYNVFILEESNSWGGYKIQK